MSRLTRALSTTPGRLRSFAAAIVVAALALALIVLSTAYEHRQAVHQIGVDDAPSVEAAHNIKVEIESLDADLLNEMLVPVGEHGQWQADFEKNRVDIGRHVIAAIHSAYGDDEDASLEKLEDGVGHYLMAAQEARDAHHRGDAAGAIAAYERSFKILETELVGPATELNTISDRSLEESYLAQQKHSHRIRIVVVIMVGLVLGLIGLLQLYLRRRFKRMLSIPLAAAFAIALIFGFYTIAALRAHARDLKGLKEDSYESVDALLASLADAYEAKSVESRWLFDKTGQGDHEKRFNEYANKLASFSEGLTAERAQQVVMQRNARMKALVAGGDSSVSAAAKARKELPLVGMDGSYKRGLDNVTFIDDDPSRDEPTQSLETLRAWDSVVALDKRIRELENGGNHQAAVQQCIGRNTGESNAAFDAFDGALTKWITINHEWMSHYRDRAYADVAKLPWLGPTAALLIVALCFLGVRPRLREYV